MKQFIRNVSIKNRIVFVLLLTIALGIWFGGPFLLIKNQYPLQQAEKRFYLILLFFLLWFLELIFTLPLKKNPKTSKSLETQQKFHILQERFKGAYQFLKKTSINKHGKRISLAQLPWYLLIGPSQSGKTSLLTQSTINFVLTKQHKFEKNGHIQNCDWWVTRDMVLVDVPGSYLSETQPLYWESFLNLLKTHCSKKQLSTIVIALPFSDLIKQETNRIIPNLKQKIQGLRTQFDTPLSFYFVITKCDQIPGFIDFFSEYSTEELAQAWGVTFPTKLDNESLLDVFIQRFNALIKRLNNQLISRLHQERNPNVRPAIKELPLQMEKLKSVLVDFFKKLGIPNLPLQGIYLTSALQAIAEEQPVDHQLTNSTAYHPLSLLHTPFKSSKAYFIRQFILQGLLSTGDSITITPVKTWYQWQRRAAYSVSIGTILLAAFLLGHDFQQSMLQTYAIYNNLTQFQITIQQTGSDDDRLIKALPLLNALHSVALKENNQLTHFQHLLSFYSDKSHKTAQIVYQQALQKIVLPAIKNSFENYLKRSDNKNPVQVYAVLKAYLSLGDTQKLQSDHIVNVLCKLFSTSLTDQAKADLITHLKAVMEDTTSSPLELDNNLIVQTRHYLRSLPSQDLVFMILKNMNNNNEDITISLGTQLTNPPVFSSHRVMNQIPAMYTANSFARINHQDIAIAATEALSGNDVLGNFESLPNEATVNTLIQESRDRYAANYADIWESLLANLNLVTPTNLSQIDAMIGILISNTSPLLQLLQTLKHHTAFDSIIALSPKIQGLNNLLVNTGNSEQHSLYQIFISLRELHNYLQIILKNTDTGNAAFNAAIHHIQKPEENNPLNSIYLLAEQSPEPIKSWLTFLAMKSWAFILQETSQFVENAWQVNIMTIYKSQFANQDIDLQEFAEFVGKEGIFANYYDHYLRPFVNESGKQWRVIQNQRIPLAEHALLQLQQMAKYQNMPKYKLFTQGRKYLSEHHFYLPSSLLMSADENG